jgi:hypothetical protein
MRYMARNLLAAFLWVAIAFVSCSQPTSMQRVADTGASPLKNRIPPPDPNKYRSVRDARDWQNPYLMVQANGIDARPISAATEAPTMSPADMVAVLGKTTVHGMALWPCSRGAGERRTCPRRRCPNQKKQRRIGTPSRKSRYKGGLVAFSVESKHSFA